MDKPETNKLSSHANLSAKIDDVVDDLFSELADQIETTADISGHDYELDDLAAGDMAFSDALADKRPADDFTLEAMGPAAASVSDEFAGVIKTNVKMLSHCAGRVTQLEKLFAGTPGYGKLFAAMKNLREMLEYQLDSLTRALTGDFRLMEPPPMLPIRRWKMRSRGGASSCPWNKLMLAKWKNTPVAFIPEQISYISTGPIICQKKYGAKTVYPLKRLKKSPLDKLKKRLSGALSALPESELRKMKLPILSHPGVFQAFSDPLPKSYLLVLSHNDQGGVVFLDTPVEDTFISSSWPWSQEPRNDSILAGHLKIYGEYLPVVDLKKI